MRRIATNMVHPNSSINGTAKLWMNNLYTQFLQSTLWLVIQLHEQSGHYRNRQLQQLDR